MPAFLMPNNIFFTSKCNLFIKSKGDIKFGDILFNNLFLQKEFKIYLKESKYYYFISPQAYIQKDYSRLSVWSLGILLYYLAYQRYPFDYDIES